MKEKKGKEEEEEEEKEKGLVGRCRPVEAWPAANWPCNALMLPDPGCPLPYFTALVLVHHALQFMDMLCMYCFDMGPTAQSVVYGISIE